MCCHGSNIGVPLVRYPYVVHYTIVDSDVIVLRVIHGARRGRWE